MHRAFRRLPLPVKLLLIGLVPLIFLVYTSYQVYTEKTHKLNLLRSYIERISQSNIINLLIDYLQQERKLSFDYAMKKELSHELAVQRFLTDSAINRLEESGLAGFKRYTFLDSLQKTREKINNSAISPDHVMHYYTTSIFRINTLNTVSPGTEIYLQPVYKDLVAQKLLSEMITNLGIMRSNIYNVLYTWKYMVETLVGMKGVYDVYKTYETEFLLKASPAAIQFYKEISGNTALRPTTEYLDTVFKRFKFDSSYSAEKWWQVSGDGMQQLINLRQDIWTNVNEGTDIILRKERASRGRTLIFLSLTLLFIAAIMIYAIYNITRMLTEMKVAAQKISEGATGIQLQIESRDVIGSLAKSIVKIDANNLLLANAADAIGSGNFDVTVQPRGKEDMLGNAVAMMKDKLVQNIRVIKENSEQMLQSAEKYKTIFYKSPLPKWIYDYETLRFLEVNEEAIRHYGYSREGFLSMTLKDIRPKEDEKKLLRQIEDVKAGNDENRGYWRHIKKNGEIITVEVTAHFIDYNGRKARMAVIKDITEKIKAEEKLKQSNEELRQLASRLQDIREEERASMAREVHDELGQQITILKMDVSWISKRLNSNDPEINKKIKETIQLLDHTATLVRKIATELRPSILDDFGLVEALHWQSREFEKKSGIIIQFKSSLPDITIPKNIAVGLFRIYQESLTNVARHAAATRVEVSIVLDDNQILLTITDNGKGFNVDESGHKKTLGLLGMKERTMMMGGKYEITSTPGKGTTVSISVPQQL